MIMRVGVRPGSRARDAIGVGGGSGPAPATKLTITTQPSSAASSGVAFPVQPVIQLRDIFNLPVLQSGVVVTATVASGGDTLGGTTTATTNSSGVATFTNLQLTGSATDTLQFAASGLTAVNSNSIAVSAASGFFANAPAGWTTINDQPFTSIPVHASGPDAQGWTDPDGNTARFSLETDPTAPFPSHGTLKGSYPNGSAGGGSFFRMALDYSSGQQFKNIYWSVIIQLSSNFDMNGNVGSKFLWPSGTIAEDSFTYTTFNADNVLEYGIVQQGGPVREMYQNIGSPGNLGVFQNYRGQYVEIQNIVRANSANGTADGEYHCWIAGTKTHQYTPADGNGVDWHMTSSGRKWMSMDINPTYGGGTAPVPVANMFMKWNRLFITGSNT